MTVMAAALVYAMVAWINQSGMIEPAWPTEPLQLNVTSTEGIARDMQRCYALNGLAPPPVEALYEQAGGVDGIYCGNRISIDGADVDLDTPAGQTVLLHELVHWVQDHNGDWLEAECIPALEYDAYMIHREWQTQMGLTPTPDEFTVVMRSQCGPPTE